MNKTLFLNTETTRLKKGDYFMTQENILKERISKLYEVLILNQDEQKKILKKAVDFIKKAKATGISAGVNEIAYFIQKELPGLTKDETLSLAGMAITRYRTMLSKQTRERISTLFESLNLTEQQSGELVFTDPETALDAKKILDRSMDVDVKPGKPDTLIVQDKAMAKDKLKRAGMKGLDRQSLESFKEINVDNPPKSVLDDIKELYDEGKSAREIADALGLFTNEVQSVINLHIQ